MAAAALTQMRAAIAATASAEAELRAAGSVRRRVEAEGSAVGEEGLWAAHQPPPSHEQVMGKRCKQVMNEGIGVYGSHVGDMKLRCLLPL